MSASTPGLARWRAVVLLALLSALLPLLTGFDADDGLRWSAQERATLATMRLDRLPPPSPDLSNALADNPAAAALGRRLFAEPGLSRNGAVACASCHAAERQFEDGRALAQGLGQGVRRTMPVPGAARSPWLFWDGRKDSLWSQALGPLEDGAEHGGNRVRVVRLLQARYRAEYEALFGRFPALEALPADASPLGTAEERQAWARLDAAQQEAVNRVFANLGKAIAAYERGLVYGEARFDRYLRALEAGDRAGQQLLTPQELDGLRLFIGRARCATCHNGPLLSDHQFHNTGVPPRDPARPDRGRALGSVRLRADEFNCLGRYSDAPPEACQELRFMSAQDDPQMEGAFRTPSLRNVALRPPYMHAGQFASLEAVLAHYRRAPAAALGRSELALNGPQRLSDREAQAIVAFLGTLSGPIEERAPQNRK